MSTTEQVPGATYAAAGVDVEAGERAVALMRSAIARAQRPEVVGGVGGFAGLFDASALTRFRRPLLATSTDGVGTKIEVARRMARPRHHRHRPGRRWSSTTWSSAGPSRCS